MSYNNKGVADAIPVPGLIDSLPGVMNFLEPVLEGAGVKLPSIDELVRSAGGINGALRFPSTLFSFSLSLVLFVRHCQQRQFYCDNKLRQISSDGFTHFHVHHHFP